MTTPTLVGSWYSRGNAPFPLVTTAANIAKSWLWTYKALLKDEVSTGTTASVIANVRGFVARPAGSKWTCEGSSNGTGAGAMDAVDRWTATFDATKIVPQSEGTNHSWIVLKSPAALGPVYVCINYCGPVVVPGDTSASAGFIWSYTPFTGGSATNRPRATISVTGDAEFSTPLGAGSPADNHYEAFTSDLALSATFLAHFAVNANGGYHFATTRNGQGKFHSYQFAEKAADAELLDIRQTWVGSETNANTRGAPGWGSFAINRVISRVWDDNSTGGNSGGVCNWTFGSSGTAFPSYFPADTITGQFRTLPLYLFDATNLKTAWRGRIPDVWAVSTPTVGGSYPNTGTPTQHVVGDLLVPFAIIPTP